MKAPNKRKKENSLWRTFAVLGAIGIDFALCVVAGYALGYFLQAWWGNVMWLLAGLFLGIAAGVWSVAVMIKRFIGD